MKPGVTILSLASMISSAWPSNSPPPTCVMLVVFDDDHAVLQMPMTAILKGNDIARPDHCSHHLPHSINRIMYPLVCIRVGVMFISKIPPFRPYPPIA